jgi:hypothetical protein
VEKSVFVLYLYRKPVCMSGHSPPHGDPTPPLLFVAKRIRKSLSTKRKLWAPALPFLGLGGTGEEIHVIADPQLGMLRLFGQKACAARVGPRRRSSQEWRPLQGKVSSQMNRGKAGENSPGSDERRADTCVAPRCLLLRRTGSRREPCLASVGCRPPAASRGLPRPTRCAKQSTVCRSRTNFRGTIPRRALHPSEAPSTDTSRLGGCTA